MKIEAMAVLGLIRAVHAVGIELARTYPLDPHVPDVTRAVACGIEINHPAGVASAARANNSSRTRLACRLKSAKFTPRQGQWFPAAMARRLERQSAPIPLLA